MIKTPDIPTDNLYKFISIFGLILFTFSIYQLIQYESNFFDQIEKHHDKLYKELEKDRIDNIEKTFLENKITYHMVMIKSKYGYKSDLDIDNEVKNKNFFSESFKKDYFELKDMQFKLQLLNNRLDEPNITNLKRKPFNEIQPIFLELLGTIGGILMYFGFQKWYHKTQKYYDKQLSIASSNPEMLNKKIEAIGKFYSIYYFNKKFDRSIIDYNEHLVNIAVDFTIYIALIEELIHNYSSVLEQVFIDKMYSLKSICISGLDEIENFDVTEKGRQLAEKFNNELENTLKYSKDIYKDFI